MNISANLPPVTPFNPGTEPSAGFQSPPSSSAARFSVSLKEVRNTRYAANWTALSKRPAAAPQSRARSAGSASPKTTPDNRQAASHRGSGQNLPHGLSASAGMRRQTSQWQTVGNYPPGLSGPGRSASSGGLDVNAGYGNNRGNLPY